MLLRAMLDGQSGRLFEELRNRRSLCYNSGFLGSTGLGPGFLVGYVLTDPASEEAALTALVTELVRAAESTPAADEFRRARSELIGGLLIANQANGARVARCANDLIYRRPANDLTRLIAEIRDCRPETVRATAERYLAADRRYEVVVGPESGAS
jgi:predicted Zn-dependent peptidase